MGTKGMSKCGKEMPLDIPLRFRPETSKCVLDKDHYDINHMSAIGGKQWDIVFYWRL